MVRTCQDCPEVQICRELRMVYPLVCPTGQNNTLMDDVVCMVVLRKAQIDGKLTQYIDHAFESGEHFYILLLPLRPEWVATIGHSSIEAYNRAAEYVLSLYEDPDAALQRAKEVCR